MGGESHASSVAEAVSALRWWLESGVDVAVGEEQRDWLKAAPASLPIAPSAPFTGAKAEAGKLGSMPESLDLFRDWLGAEPSLPFAAAGARRILPQGSEGASVMLLAEMPGLDGSGDQPIGGEAWTLMCRMLAAVGIDTDDSYVASLSCFHSPAAKMARQEMEACAAIARRHIALAKPQRLLLLGGGAAEAMLGKPLAAARGHVHQVEGVRTVATFDPRMLLERSERKANAWSDLLLLMEDPA